MSLRAVPFPEIPVLTVQVARAAFPGGTLAMRLRDELGGVYESTDFLEAFAYRGAPATSPGVLALVSVLQYAERLTDRQAADAVRGRIDWKYALSAATVAERVGWCVALVQRMAAGLVAAHWDADDIRALASGLDTAGRPLPPQACMALRRLGWGTAPPDGVTANDRITRMAQEQAGRILRSACWRDALVRAVTGTWRADSAKRTGEEWDAVRAAVPGGEHLPSPVIRARTRQAARYLQDQGRLPADVAELEAPPGVPGMLILAACDRQEATLERHEADSRRALLRLQLPARPDPRSYRDWSWVAVPLVLPPTVPGTARPPTGPLSPAGNGPCAQSAAGRVTVTRARGCGSPPAAWPTRRKPPSAATPAP